MAAPDPRDTAPDEPGFYGLVLVSILKAPLRALQNQNQLKLSDSDKTNKALVSNLLSYEKRPTLTELHKLRKGLAQAHAANPIPLEPTPDRNCIFEHIKSELRKLHDEPRIDEVKDVLTALDRQLSACLDTDRIDQLVKGLAAEGSNYSLPWSLRENADETANAPEASTPGDLRAAADVLREPHVRSRLEALQKFCHDELRGYPAPPRDRRLLARRLLAIPRGARKLEMGWIEVTAGLEHMSGEWLQLSGDDQIYLARSQPLAAIVKENLARMVADRCLPGAAQVPDTRRDEIVHAGTVVLGPKVASFTTHGSSGRAWTRADEYAVIMRLRRKLTDEAGSKPDCESMTDLERFGRALLSFALLWDPVTCVHTRLEYLSELDGRTFDLTSLERLQWLREALRVLCDTSGTSAELPTPTQVDQTAGFVVAARRAEEMVTAKPENPEPAKQPKKPGSSKSRKQPKPPIGLRRMESLLQILQDERSRSAFAAGRSLGSSKCDPSTSEWKSGYAKTDSALWFIAGWRRGLYPTDDGTPSDEHDPMRPWAKAMRDLDDYLRRELDGYEPSAVPPAYRVARGGAVLYAGLHDILSNAPSGETLLIVPLAKDGRLTRGIFRRRSLLDGVSAALRARYHELTQMKSR